MDEIFEKRPGNFYPEFEPDRGAKPEYIGAKQAYEFLERL